MAHPAIDQRTGRARDALAAYGGNGGEDPDAVCDLLADLMHLCDVEGLDFDQLAETARMHFASERAEGDSIEQAHRASLA